MSAVVLIVGVAINFYIFGFGYGILANVIWFVIWNIACIILKTKRNLDYYKEMDRKYNIKQ